MELNVLSKELQDTARQYIIDRVDQCMKEKVEKYNLDELERNMCLSN